LNFKYRAINTKGKKESGEILAQDKAAAISMLKDKGMIPLDIKPAKNGTELKSNVSGGKAKNKSFRDVEIMEKDIHEAKISKKKILGVLSQFAVLIKAGVPLSLCIQVLVAQEKDRRLKKILTEIQEDMYAMSKFKSFNNITVSMISAGEVNGKLDTAFERASKILENEVEVGGKIKGAMGYPLFLLGLTMFVVIILNIVVMPIFSDMFDQMGADLPLITRIVMGISAVIMKFWYLFVALILLTIGSYTYSRKNSRAFRIKTDKIILELPLIGDILHKLYIARFCRVMSSMVDAGVEIIHALTVSSNVISNAYMNQFFNSVLEDVKVGVPINIAMSRHHVFDSLLTSMVRVGEESGMLHSVLDKMADLYETQTESRTKLLTSMIEPVMTIIIALVVGTVVISVVMPMFGQYKLIL